VARQFLSALEKSSLGLAFTVNERSLGDWLSWAHEKVEAADPLLMGATGHSGSQPVQCRSSQTGQADEQPQGHEDEVRGIVGWAYL
jgi:hypothetical protein